MSGSIAGRSEDASVGATANARALLTRARALDAGAASSAELARGLNELLEYTEGLESHRAVLLQQQAALRTVISSVPFFVFWKDRDCVYRGCNDIFATLGGLDKPDDIIGRTDYDMPWTKEQSDLYREDDLRVIRSGQPKLNIEETNLDSDGNEKVILTSKVPLLANDGEIIGMLGIFTDISARKQMEKDLGKSKEQAEAANRAKSDFLAAMSHELRTPLTMILSPVESLLADRDSALSGSTREVLQRVQRNAHRLKVLTDDILDFSKHQAGHLQLNREVLDLGEHLSQLILDMTPTAMARGITLRLDADRTSLGVVSLDVAKFDKIIINLVGNALKFTPPGGNVTVTTKVEGRELCFQVADDGPGIDPRDQERLFRRFEQVDGTSKRRHGGTGLGLALVKEFVALMGGSVNVKSALGAGATFSFAIPRQLAEMTAESALRGHVERANHAVVEPPAPLEQIESPTPSAKPDAPLVVIAEDNDDLRGYIARLLSAEFRVLAVPDGQAAYDAVRQQPPDVIVSDVMMPLMDGFELVDKLKADAELSTIPVLLLTARAGVNASADSLNRGADDYLAKPFSPLDLISRVRAAQRMRVLNIAVRQAERRAEFAERLAGVGRLLAKLSHELNNPINVVYNGLIPIGDYSLALIRYAEECDAFITKAGGSADIATLRRSLDYDFVIEDMPAAIGTLREAAARIRDVQADLRLFLHGRTSFNCSKGDLNELVSSSFELIRRGSLRPPRAEVRLGEIAPFSFDRGRLGQAIFNLLKNAVEAAGAEGHISVETHMDGATARVLISDDGPGVPEAIQRKIFEPFFTTKDVGGGTGLGLRLRRARRGEAGEPTVQGSCRDHEAVGARGPRTQDRARDPHGQHDARRGQPSRLTRVRWPFASGVARASALKSRSGGRRTRRRARR